MSNEFVDKLTEAERSLIDMRWPDGVRCPVCDSPKVYFISTRRKFKCAKNTCYRQFSILSGTDFQDSKMPLETIVKIIDLQNQGARPIDIHRETNVRYTTALLHSKSSR